MPAGKRHLPRPWIAITVRALNEQQITLSGLFIVLAQYHGHCGLPRVLTWGYERWPMRF
jgi:hypothetical protein